MDNVKMLDHYRGPVFDGLPEKGRERILHIQLGIQQCLINIKCNFFEIGKLLSEAKNLLPHGTFQRWIEVTWREELPYPTAACFKAIYEKFKDHREAVLKLPITLLQQMAQATFPDEILKLITDNPEVFKEGDIGLIKEAHRDFKEGKIDLGQFEALAAKQIKIGMAMLEGRTYERNSLSGKRIIKSGFNKLKSAIWKMRKYTGKIRGFFPPGEPVGFIRDEDAYNSKVDAVTAAILDDDLINEIDACIEELKKLKVEVEDRRGLFRERLVKEEGVIKKTTISNL